MSLFFPFVFLVTFCEFATTGPTWFPGYMKQLSTKGNHLWGVDPFNRLLRWETSAWTYAHIFESVSYVAVATDGTAYVVLTNKCSKTYHPATDKFVSSITPVDVCLNGLGAVMVSAGSNSSVLFSGTDGELFHYKDNMLFAVFSAQEIIQGAIGDDGEMWMIDTNNNPFRYNGQSWVKMSGWGIYTIDVQNASRIVASNWDGLVYKWNGAGWTNVNGFSDCRQATINYVSIFCVTTRGDVYKMDV